MALSTEEVRKIADLARLRLNGSESEILARQLGEIVAYIDQMAGHETADPDSESSGLALEPFERADEVGGGISQRVFLANAPRSMGPFLVVPAVRRREG